MNKNNSNDVLEFLGMKSYTVSFRLKISEIQKMINGEEITIKLKGVEYTIKKSES